MSIGLWSRKRGIVREEERSWETKWSYETNNHNFQESYYVKYQRALQQFVSHHKATLCQWRSLYMFAFLSRDKQIIGNVLRIDRSWCGLNRCNAW